jgi:DNA-binding NarL/FixJ family response regulator
MRVIVAEDLMLTREGIVRLLAEAGVNVIAQVPDSDGLLSLVAAHKPDAVILDIRMPPTHTDEGIVAAGRIRDAFPGVGVLVLSQYVEPSWALRLVAEHPEGVGYLLKERVVEMAVIVDALRRVVDGETVVDPTIVARLLGRRRRQDPLAALSSREREVLGLVAEGLTNRAIAEQLVVAERTVEAHISSIFGKLDIPESPDRHRRVLAVLTLLRS